MELTESETKALQKLDEAFAMTAVLFAANGRTELLLGDYMVVAHALQDLNDNLGRKEFLV